ncbi:dihydroxyacetone kinase subunit L [Desemzia sp. C1]|uniref:dihydroxyacetone kinase subunit DhaL n=1 Tax=Desemzia sp. C1 TaxID=2892016 RepID=UPI001E29894E|nr:dihydroxyacetone kinase subunit DhaL [Desemzia sp. C1]MCI3028818.1 dihydroxyacetone kinase subunit L [Desemzia sp. C1]
MTLTLDRDFFKKSIVNMADLIEKERDHLTKLDSDIGDGDHGINMTIGFREVTKKLDEFDENAEDINSFLKKVGMSLLGKVGGASGPLYGSLFMKMGADVTGKKEVTFNEFIGMLENGVVAVETRGKAVVGEKTMVDALRPGIDFLKAQSIDGNELEVYGQFIDVMKEGSDKTIPLVAKKGRALRLGERAIGHRDPGSESSWMLMNAFYEEMQKQLTA